MELKEIIPQKIGFTLEKIGRPLTLSPITLDIDEWLRENYPGDKLQMVLTTPSVKDILKIAAKLLDRESRKALAKSEIVETDDFGNETKLDNMTLDMKLYRLTSEVEFTLILLAIVDVRKRSFDLLTAIQNERMP